MPRSRRCWSLAFFVCNVAISVLADVSVVNMNTLFIADLWTDGSAINLSFRCILIAMQKPPSTRVSLNVMALKRISESDESKFWFSRPLIFTSAINCFRMSSSLLLSAAAAALRMSEYYGLHRPVPFPPFFSPYHSHHPQYHHHQYRASSYCGPYGTTGAAPPPTPPGTSPVSAAAAAAAAAAAGFVSTILFTFSLAFFPVPFRLFRFQRCALIAFVDIALENVRHEKRRRVFSSCSVKASF
jgi:hypothetical protein